MDRICRRCVYNSFGNNYITALRRLVLNRQKYDRLFSTSTFLQAAKSTKKTPLKKHKPALEYKPRQPPPRPNLSPPPKPANPFKYRTIPFVAATIVLGVFSCYGTYLLIQVSRTPSSTITLTTASTQHDVSSRYDTIARTFDSSISSTEWLMGLPKLRRKLASMAHGDVLEVSIGTGRNLEFYDWNFRGYNGVGKPAPVREGGLKKRKVRSFTAVDKSAEMLEVAHEKFSAMFPGILGVRWVVGDASGEIPAPPRNADERSGNIEGGKYDTVLQTMGLCSVVNPVALLKNLGKVVKEEDGRILLLEHGRGRWYWLNDILDRYAEGHANNFGCWWNRDLNQIIQESGLEVVEIKTWHGGTTWWIELKKPREQPFEVKSSVIEVVSSEKPPKQSGWW